MYGVGTQGLDSFFFPLCKVIDMSSAIVASQLCFWWVFGLLKRFEVSKSGTEPQPINLGWILYPTCIWSELCCCYSTSKLRMWNWNPCSWRFWFCRWSNSETWNVKLKAIQMEVLTWRNMFPKYSGCIAREDQLFIPKCSYRIKFNTTENLFPPSSSFHEEEQFQKVLTVLWNSGIAVFIIPLTAHLASCVLAPGLSGKSLVPQI
jgi:hypothetical protein